jgi:methionyl-tRNA synthetase
MTKRRRILVTSALPFANGPLHLGHILEAVQTDIWVRFQKLRGHECYYVCADDTHGTPIMLKAQSEGLTPEQLIAQVKIDHQRDFSDMLIGMDNFGSTHSAENKVLCERMYLLQREGGYIDKRSVRQAYDDTAQMFLPDRYVRGTCPVCATPDQYGDSCENCGSTYTPADLKDAISVVSGTTPVWRESEHFFFKLSAFEKPLRAWIQSGAVQASAARKLDEWFSQGLRDWDISRDAPYFGFEIPDAPLKYFYVWFDAPIGYLASFTQLCARTGLKFDDFFHIDSTAELHHFIGKDILYFHALFWPAVLQASAMRRPTAVHTHGFVTINGQKMSKSRGTFITARRYLQNFPAEYLRYYFAAKLGSGIDDMDMNLDEFTTRLNSEIVGKLVNIASRCAGFITRNSGGQLAGSLADEKLYGAFVAAGDIVAQSYEGRDTAGAMREIMALADRANQYVDSRKPWMLAKDPNKVAEVQLVCTLALNLFRVLMIYLQPVLPQMAARASAFFQETDWTWAAAAKPRLSTAINAYEPLAVRLDPKAMANLVGPEAAVSPAPAVANTSASDTATLAAATSVEGNLISIDDFLRIDLRVAKILTAELIAGADKLLKLRVDVGELGEREIFAGIRAAYDPATLVGRLIVVVANLEPRKMRFGTSEGMMLAAGPGGKDIFALSADSGATPGMRVK